MRNAFASFQTPNGALDLSRVKLKNYKALAEVDLRLAPLTFVLGANSKGKSSLLEAILLMAEGAVSGKSDRLDVNTGSVKLGLPAEIIRRRADGKQAKLASISIGLKSRFPDSRQRVRQLEHLVEFKVDSSSSPFLRIVAHEYSNRSQGEAEILSEKSKRATYNEQLSRQIGSPTFVLSKQDPTSNARLAIQEPESRGDSLFPSRKWHEFSRIEYFEEVLETWIRAARTLRTVNKSTSQRAQDTDPLAYESLVSKISDLLEDHLIQIEQESLEIQVNSKNYKLLRPIEGIDPLRRLAVPLIQDYLRAGDAGSPATLRADVSSYLRGREKERPASDRYLIDQSKLGSPLFSLDASEIWTEKMKGGISYLGPLRDRQQISFGQEVARRSPIAPLGAKGEFLGTFVWDQLESNEQSFTLPNGDSGDFMEALSTWTCDFFELGERVSIETEGLIGPVLRLDGNRFQHLGTGVSQLLPVIVLCISSKPGTTIILEQPELHLHPALQQRLASFLAFFSASGLQLIVETHSEYMVTRIRRHVAEGHVPSESVSLVFAEPGGRMTDREISGNGALNDYWPEEFFDFSLEDSIALLRAQETG